MPDTVKEMMSAYVAGCMDLRNLDQFVKFLDEGNYIPLDELGELQNIASLIPVLLEREAPPASLQNNIFSQIPETTPEEEQPKRIKRKVNLSEIIKEELDSPEEKSETEDEPEIEIPENISFTSLNRNTVADEVAEKIEEEIFASKKTSRREEKNKREILEESETSDPHPHVKIKAKKNDAASGGAIVIPPENESAEETPETEIRNEETQIEKKRDFVWKISAAAAVLLAVIFAVMYFSSRSSYNEEISELQKVLTANKIEIEDKTDFINVNLPLIEIFELKDLILVEMASTENSGKTEARIVISPSARRGILQFVTTPNIGKNESLQLWVVNKGQSYSVGIFHPSPEKKFYQLSKIPFIPFDEIEMFRITKEPRDGSEFPSGGTVYFGAIRIK